MQELRYFAALDERADSAPLADAAVTHTNLSQLFRRTRGGAEPRPLRKQQTGEEMS